MEWEASLNALKRGGADPREIGSIERMLAEDRENQILCQPIQKELQDIQEKMDTLFNDLCLYEYELFAVFMHSGTELFYS
jgi:hypothetical protein